VIYNLIDNAVKFTPPQGRVTIKVFQQDREIRMQVIDTGIGIPTADQPRIFDKFHRVKHEYVDEVKGTGLGLAITKGIVEKHNGRIWLESVPGEGSTFTVILPVPQELYDPA
jgi:signal transduction histidine kinase